MGWRWETRECMRVGEGGREGGRGCGGARVSE